MKLILTCEHGGAEIPGDLVARFQPHADLLRTHRGLDFGALSVFEALVPLAALTARSTVCRLVVDLNRSRHHRQLFSAITRDLPPTERERLLAEHYYPYRQRVESTISGLVDAGDVVFHLSIHSFTPELNGELRNADLGLLYDPRRDGERQLAKRWRVHLSEAWPQARVRMNYPYRGTSDGVTSYLRKRFAPTAYAGIELELNQALLDGQADFPPWVLTHVRSTLSALLSAPAGRFPPQTNGT